MDRSIKYQPYDTFFEDSISAFDVQLYDLFLARYDQKKDKRVFRIQSSDALNELVKNTGIGKGRFPIITSRLTNITPNIDGGFNTPELRRKGIAVRMPQKSGDLNHKIMHPEATLATMEVSLIAKDYSDVLFFAKRWMDSIKNGYFDFELMVYQDPFKIKVRGQDASVAIPQPDEIVSDTGKFYLVETGGAELHTYIMSTDIRPAIKRYHLKGNITNQALETVETGFDVSRSQEDIEKDKL